MMRSGGRENEETRAALLLNEAKPRVQHSRWSSEHRVQHKGQVGRRSRRRWGGCRGGRDSVAASTVDIVETVVTAAAAFFIGARVDFGSSALLDFLCSL
jgi:hypothetical protein